MGKVNVVIVGSNPLTRLSLIRSIGEDLECNITIVNMVHSIESERKVLPSDCSSKYVSGYYEALKYDSESITSILLNKCCDDSSKPFLFSVDDDSTRLIDSSITLLKDHFHCACINGKDGQIEQWMDKQNQKKLALECGFSVARSWRIDYVDDRYIVPDDIVYPCFLKGLMSYHSMKAAQGKYDSKESLEAALNALTLHFPMMAEEYLSIDKELGVMGYSDGDECVIPAIVELLESGKGNHHGVSAFGKVRMEDSSEDIISKTRKFISGIGLKGIFNIDLAISGDKICFVESNLRYAAYGYAVKRAGVNMPVFSIKSKLGLPVEPDEKIIEGELHYVNDLVALDDWAFGFRSMKNYRNLQSLSDVSLLNVQDDPRPYKLILRRSVLKRGKYIVKRLLKRV